MNTNSQPKKSSSPRKNSRKKHGPDLKAIENGTWNPFERVDPKILEMLHRKHEKARKYYLLTDTEESPV
jgi:hypothetical protein